IERIAVRSSCAEASLPSLVRRFARGNLPIAVWWTEDFSTRRLIDPLVALGRQVVFDSAGWTDFPAGIRALAGWLDRDLIDVNWRRLAPMRRALASAAEGLPAAAWTPDRVRIAHRPEAAALAWLAAGWLTSRLRWRAWPAVDEDKDADAVLTMTIGSGD